MRSFATTDRFAADMAARKLRPAYVLVGDEGFFAAAAATPSSST